MSNLVLIGLARDVNIGITNFLKDFCFVFTELLLGQTVYIVLLNWSRCHAKY